MDMSRRRIPTDFLLVTGLLLLVVGGALWVVRDTLVATDRITATSDQILAEQPVRDLLAVRLAETLEPPVEQTPPDELQAARAVADSAVQTPAFAQAFRRTLREMHGHLFAGDTDPIVLDETLVTEAVRDAGGSVTSRVAVSVDTDVLPDLSRSSRAAGTAIPLLVGAGLLLVVAALSTGEHRARIVMRIGRWMVATGLATIAFMWLVPLVVLRPTGGWLGVAGIVIATGDAVIWPAAMVAVAGVVAIAAGHRWETTGRRRVLSVIPRVPGRHVDGWQSPV